MEWSKVARVSASPTTLLPTTRVQGHMIYLPQTTTYKKYSKTFDSPWYYGNHLVLFLEHVLMQNIPV